MSVKALRFIFGRPPDPRPAVSLPRHDVRVLLVERDPGSAARIARSLERPAGHWRLTHAASVPEAVAILESSAFDAVVLDIGHAPAGLDALRRIREASPAAPIVVCAGREDPDLAIHAMADGAQDWVFEAWRNGALLERSIRYAIARKRSERAIHELAYHDPLTGLPNRLLLHDRICRSLAQGRRHRQPFAVLYVDVDDFKGINDSFGHGGGDAMLKVVAGRLCDAVRSTDTVARLGGDEFIVLLSELNSTGDAAVVAAKIQGWLARPCPLQGTSVSVSASIGIAVWPEDGDGAEQLLERADLAMYKAKRSRGSDVPRARAPMGPLSD
jgi:diguanylate cyclase (GGDEF)-like protein